MFTLHYDPVSGQLYAMHVSNWISASHSFLEALGISSGPIENFCQRSHQSDTKASTVAAHSTFLAVNGEGKQYFLDPGSMQKWSRVHCLQVAVMPQRVPLMNVRLGQMLQSLQSSQG